MSTNNSSRELDSHLEKHIPENLEKSLNNLKALGIDPKVFEKFHDKIEGILAKNPEAEGLVSGEIGKIHLSIENNVGSYTRMFRSVLMETANNVDYFPNQSANNPNYRPKNPLENSDISDPDESLSA